MIDFLNNLDMQALLAVNSHHAAVPDIFMMAYTGKLIWAPLYLALAWFVWKRAGWAQAIVIVLAIVATIALADQTCATLLRPIFERLRPSHSTEIGGLVNVVNGYRGGLYGFPSCHAANSVALTVWFFLLCGARSRLSMMLLVWCLLTCYTRMYLGVHYPGDLLFGSVVGSLCALLCWFLAVRIFKIGKFRGDTATQIPLAAFLLTVTALLIYSIVAHLVR